LRGDNVRGESNEDYSPEADLGEVTGLAVSTVTRTGDSSASTNEICDFCLYDGEGNFTSYGYPLPYRPSLNCSYRVQRVDEFDTCELELTFHDFELPNLSDDSNAVIQQVQEGDPNSVNCTQDYLEVSGQRFCGSYWAGKQQTVAFPADLKELTFRYVCIVF
jgi:hypothetical protein